ncbi:hypothetical protein LOTGIDRAFT_238434 [Lottia gigantea]|uniref:Uncharacterized protein n=1 Tax=Lottia gigantea TaxID=225164 RepID=V4B0U6_LOTGI|nr:hypothetical protein LOTGIDRAFT_238434 [Lottia gigantea]ESP00871.1 hypothetical protein LOTGIDRAFT_238434 [Lottia gigantea]
MEERGRKKEKIRFRNTIDPEFSRLRRALNWLKPTGVVGIMHGCILMATAVTIILSFKRTFLEGQSYSSRITPNFVIGITSLAAGVRAVCIKSEVGFSLDKPALKCVVGFCGVSTFVSLAMSVLLICLSAFEYNTLISDPPNYSFIGDRIALNIMNLVVSSISTLVCAAMLVVYVRVAMRFPLVKPLQSERHAENGISVISNGHVIPLSASDAPDVFVIGVRKTGYVNGSYTSHESVADVGSDPHHGNTKVANGHMRNGRIASVTDDTISLDSSNTSLPANRGIPINANIRQAGVGPLATENPVVIHVRSLSRSPVNVNMKIGSSSPTYQNRHVVPDNRHRTNDQTVPQKETLLAVANRNSMKYSDGNNGIPTNWNTARNSERGYYEQANRNTGRQLDRPLSISANRNEGRHSEAANRNTERHVDRPFGVSANRNEARHSETVNRNTGRQYGVSTIRNDARQYEPTNRNSNRNSDYNLTANRNRELYLHRAYNPRANQMAGYSNSSNDSGIENQNIPELRQAELFGVRLDRSPRMSRNSDV